MLWWLAEAPKEEELGDNNWKFQGEFDRRMSDRKVSASTTGDGKNLEASVLRPFFFSECLNSRSVTQVYLLDLLHIAFFYLVVTVAVIFLLVDSSNLLAVPKGLPISAINHGSSRQTLL